MVISAVVFPHVVGSSGIPSHDVYSRSFYVFFVSCRLVLGLPRLLFPIIPLKHYIVPLSCLTTKYLVILPSSVHSGLMFLIPVSCYFCYAVVCFSYVNYNLMKYMDKHKVKPDNKAFHLVSYYDDHRLFINGAISTTPSRWIATAGSHRRWPTSSPAVY